MEMLRNVLFDVIDKVYTPGDKYTPIRFSDKTEADDYVGRNYKDLSKSLCGIDLGRIMSICSHSLNTISDKNAIEEIEKAFSVIKGLPDNVVLFRSGEMRIENRPYLSASFCADISRNYLSFPSVYPHVIIAKKNSRIIPLRAITEHAGETEVIIDSRRLEREGNYYIYK